MTPEQIANTIIEDPSEQTKNQDPEDLKFLAAMEKFKKSLEDEGGETQKIDPSSQEELLPRQDVSDELLSKQKSKKYRRLKKPHRKVPKKEFGKHGESSEFSPFEEPGDWSVDLEWIQRIADSIED